MTLTRQIRPRVTPEPGRDRRDLLRGGVASIIIKIIQALIGVALAMVLARGLGAELYGTYSFAIAVILVAAIPAQMGIPSLVVRETASKHAKHEYDQIGRLWRWSTRCVLGYSTLVTLTLALILVAGRNNIQGTTLQTMAIGCVLIPLLALGNLRGASLRGLKRVVLGQLPENTIRPLLFLLLSYILFRHGLTNSPSPQLTMALYGIAALFSFITGSIILRRTRPQEKQPRIASRGERRHWLRASLTLALLSGVQVLNGNVDIICLGLLGTPYEAGVYRASFQTTLIATFGLQALVHVAQPYFSKYKADNDKKRLQRLTTACSQATLAFALMPASLFVLFGAVVLGILFGPEYESGASVLAILSAGHLFNASMGPVGVLLNMTGHEAYSAKASAASLLCNGGPYHSVQRDK